MAFGCTMCGSTEVLVRVEGAVLEFLANPLHKEASEDNTHYPLRTWVKQYSSLTYTCRTCGHVMDRHEEISSELYQQGAHLRALMAHMSSSRLSGDTQTRVRELIQADLIARRLKDGAK